MESLVIRVDPPRRSWWKQTLQDLLPDLKVLLWDEDHYTPDEVRYAVVWNPPNGGLARFPNLKCVVSIGAGVAHVLKDPQYPSHVPLIRTVSAGLQMRMTEYVMLHVLRHHRRLPEIECNSQNHKWEQYFEPLSEEMTVGLLGLGNLGGAAARALKSIGYNVTGWSRRGHPVDGVEVHNGQEGLFKVARSSNIVVCMLPETRHTVNILDSSFFHAMPAGSYFINVGRGEVVVDDDLISALHSGHIRAATLDVFREEPLPDTHPFWSTPNVLVTSHTASAIEPRMGGEVIAKNINDFRQGRHVADMVDLDQGY